MASSALLVINIPIHGIQDTMIQNHSLHRRIGPLRQAFKSFGGKKIRDIQGAVVGFGGFRFTAVAKTHSVEIVSGLLTPVVKLVLIHWWESTEVGLVAEKLVVLIRPHDVSFVVDGGQQVGSHGAKYSIRP